MIIAVYSLSENFLAQFWMTKIKSVTLAWRDTAAAWSYPIIICWPIINKTSKLPFRIKKTTWLHHRKQYISFYVMTILSFTPFACRIEDPRYMKLENSCNSFFGFLIKSRNQLLQSKRFFQQNSSKRRWTPLFILNWNYTCCFSEF